MDRLDVYAQMKLGWFDPDNTFDNGVYKVKDRELYTPLSINEVMHTDRFEHVIGGYIKAEKLLKKQRLEAETEVYND